MKFTITQLHIDAGIKGACGDCPVTLAVSEALPRYRVETGMLTLYVKRPNTDFNDMYPLPYEVKKFIRDFDCDRLVYPFSFELPIIL